MPTENRNKVKSAIGVALGCVLAFSITMMLTTCLFSSRNNPDLPRNGSPSRTRDGFDFTPIRNAQHGAGPEVGNRIDLTRLKSGDGESLAATVGEGPAMLALVDPECALCKTASDEMRYVRNQLSDIGVPYYFVHFTLSTPSPSLGRFINSLGVEANLFVWSKDEGLPPEQLFTMVIPSHILIDESGTIINKWPGSNNDKLIRDRMANQIVYDVLDIMSYNKPTR